MGAIMKILKRSLIVVLLLTVTGCQVIRNVERILDSHVVNREFSEYLYSLDDLNIDPAKMARVFAVANPTESKKKVEDYRLLFKTHDDYKSYLKRVDETITKLKSFDDTNFTSQELTDKAVLIEYFENVSAMRDFYDFEFGTKVIAHSRSFMGMLPSYLESYSFSNQKDVDAYFNFIETLPSAVDPHLAFEQDRQKRGTGFSAEELRSIALQYEAIATAALSDDYFLIRNFNSRIDTLNYSGNKDTIKAKHRNLVHTHFALAYQKIANAFKGIEGKPMMGLASKPEGRLYYERLLQQSSGKNQSIEDIEAMLHRKKESAKAYLDTLSLAKRQAYDARNDRREFGNFKDGYEMVAFIEKASKADFPIISMPKYELRQVDSSVSASTSPAFYLIKSLESDDASEQIIYINGHFDNADYPTYAHESIPGHMYQFNYFKTLEAMHPIRSKFSLTANLEGWATYIENRSVAYVSDAKYQAYYQAMATLGQISYIEADIGIHYYGWTLEQFARFMKENFGDVSESAIYGLYLECVTNPTTYPAYFLSSLYFEDLRTQVESALGESFNARKFHKLVLDPGSASFNFIQQKVDEFIAGSKGKNASQ